jgi:two-component system cell cycle response regulator CpdR
MLKHLKILLIDDDPALVKTLSLFLRYEGHEVYATTDPFVACYKVMEEPFDLVIADLVMPEMSGYDLVARCKGCQSQIKVILITGHYDMLPDNKEVQTLYNKILPKPLDIDKLLEELKEIQQISP